jgi:serine protease Do
MTAVEELQQAALAVAERIGPSTVAIGQDQRGTGVVIGEGRVLTNVHNLRDRTTQITFADGTSTQGEVIGSDPDGDLVVLAVDGVPTTPAEWSPAVPTVGQVVFAAARGRHGLRVTFGLVSGAGRAFRGPRGRRIAGSVEHTAPLARGSSGGPLLDAEGRLLGLNTRRLDDGFYLAIPADAELQERVSRLAAGESPSRRRLGVAVAPAHVARRLRRAVGLPERDGLLVRGVDDGSPAARAGLSKGDLIVSANGRDIRTADDLWDVLDGLDEAERVSLGIVRGADEMTVGVTFAEGASATEEGSA